MNSDILIIGGGIIGLATAFRLAGAGAAVTVVERSAVGTEASWAGGGILAPLLPWQYPSEVNDLCHLSAELYPDWINAVESAGGRDAEYWRCGMEILPPYDEAAAESWCDRYHWPLHAIASPDALTKTGPALWLPDVAQVRNPRLVKALRAAVLARGVRLLEHTGVSGIAVNENRVNHVSTAQGKLCAETYITCAGAWSQQVLADHPPAKTVRPVRGQMLLFQAEPDCLRHIVYHEEMYIIPRRDGHILVGSTLEEVGFDKSTTTEAKNILLDHALRVFPALRDAKLKQHWSGLRPGSPDNIPTIARHPVVDNLYVNAGHFRYGVTMAPLSANLVAELIEHKTPQMDISPYRW
ncbi:MAG: glycine oxidase ThiO [Burkholderiales bacterium]